MHLWEKCHFLSSVIFKKGIYWQSLAIISLLHFHRIAQTIQCSSVWFKNDSASNWCDCVKKSFDSTKEIQVSRDIISPDFDMVFWLFHKTKLKTFRKVGLRPHVHQRSEWLIRGMHSKGIISDIINLEKPSELCFTKINPTFFVFTKVQNKGIENMQLFVLC